MQKIFYFPLKITTIIWDTEVHFIMYQYSAIGPPFFRVMPKTRLAFPKFCFEEHLIDPLTPRPPHGEFIATLTFNCGRNLVVSPFKRNLFRRTFVRRNINNWSRDYVMRMDKIINALIFDETLSTNCSKKCIKIGLENLFADWGSACKHDAPRSTPRNFSRLSPGTPGQGIVGNAPRVISSLFHWMWA